MTLSEFYARSKYVKTYAQAGAKLIAGLKDVLSVNDRSIGGPLSTFLRIDDQSSSAHKLVLRYFGLRLVFRIELTLTDGGGTGLIFGSVHESKDIPEKVLTTKFSFNQNGAVYVLDAEKRQYMVPDHVLPIRLIEEMVTAVADGQHQISFRPELDDSFNP